MGKKNLNKHKYHIEYTRWEEDLSVSHHIRYFNDYFYFADCLKRMLDSELYHIVTVYKD